MSGNYFQDLVQKIKDKKVKAEWGRYHSVPHSHGNQPQQFSGNANGELTSKLLTQAKQKKFNEHNIPFSSSFSDSVNITQQELDNYIKVLQQEPINTSPNDALAFAPLLPKPLPEMRGKKCLVVDVDETLVHSSYQPSKEHKHDFFLQLTIAGQICNIYVAYRPYVQEFFRAVGSHFEVVIFTASVAMYCNPLMDHLDSKGLLGPHRLFRHHCCNVQGSYVKDLSLLGRDLKDVLIIDNNPVAYLFHQRNAIPIPSWFNDKNDTELLKLLPTLMELAKSDNIYDILDRYNGRLQLEALKLQQMQ